MDEYKVRHLPLVNGDEFSGLIYEDDLMDLDEETPMAAFQARAVFTTPQSHLYDVVGQLVAAEVDALPVVDEGVYKGCECRLGGAFLGRAVPLGDAWGCGDF